MSFDYLTIRIFYEQKGEKEVKLLKSGHSAQNIEKI
jgi:hypothetical protein